MSNQILKQLKIKTSMLIRLRKQYISYQKQTKGIKNKIDGLTVIAQRNQDQEVDLKKNKQFLQQSQSVLSNVKQKLIQAFQGLANFLKQKGGDAGVDQSQERKKAQEVILEAQTFLQGLQE